MFGISSKIFFLLPAMVLIHGDSDAQAQLDKATFAGGCFWCMEHPFEQLKGVLDVVSGYTGGHEKDPTYEEISSGKTGHVEAVQVIFDPSRTTYSEILDLFWRQVDPTDPGGQFVDRGPQYRTAIFYHNEGQKALAEKSRADLDNSGIYDKPIVTEIIRASRFYKAEGYHQDYHRKNPMGYKQYRRGSGRDQYLKNVWKDKTPVEVSRNHSSKYKKQSEEELKMPDYQYSIFTIKDFSTEGMTEVRVKMMTRSSGRIMVSPVGMIISFPLTTAPMIAPLGNLMLRRGLLTISDVSMAIISIASAFSL